MSDTIRLGVSACLLGQRVRYDGQHKLDPFLTSPHPAELKLRNHA
jgi:uncharacterized protein YbbK (DUF523 family)